MIVGWENRSDLPDVDRLETETPGKCETSENLLSTQELREKFELLFPTEVGIPDGTDVAEAVPLGEKPSDRGIVLGDGTVITLPPPICETSQGQNNLYSVADIFERAKADKELKQNVLSWLKESYPDLEKQWKRGEGKNDGVSLEERKQLVREFVSGLAETMGVTIDHIEFDKMPDNCYGSCELNRPLLHINEKFLKSPSDPSFALDNLLNTSVHELRHQYQKEAVSDPTRSCASPAQIEAWKKNFLPGNYVLAKEDYLGYRMQPVEKDAFDFADDIIRKLKSEVDK